MMGRKSVIGLAVLCALVFSAISATSAFAGGRAFTCAPGGTQFSDAHCLTAGTGFGHEEIANNKETFVTVTNERTASGTTAAEVSKLKGKIAGIATEVQCTGVSGEGELFNRAAFVEGTGELTYTGCTVTLPAGRECIVPGGTVTTEELFATTEGLGANEIEVEPVVPPVLAVVPIAGCKAGLPPPCACKVEGSLIATTSGATATTIHATITAQKTLTLAGNAAGLQGALTISMEGGNPIVLT
jgi:hypothetical protein